jgi:hypothetical protein
LLITGTSCVDSTSFIGGPTLNGITSATGANHLNKNGLTALQAVTGNLNNILFVDGQRYATLAAAVTACPSVGCLIYDTLPETFTANPFAGSSGKAITVQFGGGVWTCNYAPAAGSGCINIFPTQRLLGTGRLFGATSGTIIRAGASLGANPLIKLDGTQGTRAENLNVDCNSVAGSTGIYATDINENAGIKNVVVINCPAFGINIDASVFVVIPAQNYDLEDIEIFPQAAGTAATVGMRLRGNGGGGPSLVKNITSNGIVGNVIGTGLQIQNFTQTTFINIHVEQSTLGFSLVGAADCVSNIVAIGISAGNAVAGGQNLVNIPAGCQGNGFSFYNIQKNGATNALNDVPRGVTRAISKLDYVVGTGAIGSADIWSTDSGIQKAVTGGVTFLGAAAFNTTLSVGGGTNLAVYRRIAVSLTPVAVAANTCAAQSFTVTGLSVSDILIGVNKPSEQAGLAVTPGHVTAVNTATINFCNTTALAITPTAAETYNFVVVQ